MEKKNEQEQAPQHVVIKEDISSMVLAVNKILTVMAEEYLKSVHEVKLCHNLIGGLNGRVKSLEDKGSKEKNGK